MNARTRDHDNRLAAWHAELSSLRTRVDVLATGRPVAGTAATASLSNAAARLDVANGPPTIDLGIRMLEQGQYESARTLFERLQTLEPDDARVWYFGAIAVGLVSGDWEDRAKELAEKGLDRECAGTPPGPVIDAALATRVPLLGEPWLDALRRRELNRHRTQ